MGVWAEGLASADPGARTPIGTSRNCSRSFSFLLRVAWNGKFFKYLLVLIGGWVECLACANPGARSCQPLSNDLYTNHCQHQSFQLSQAVHARLRNQSGRVRNQKIILSTKVRTISWGCLSYILFEAHWGGLIEEASLLINSWGNLNITAEATYLRYPHYTSLKGQHFITINWGTLPR
jgi:hypothetical protein